MFSVPIVESRAYTSLSITQLGDQNFQEILRSDSSKQHFAVVVREKRVLLCGIRSDDQSLFSSLVVRY